MKQKSMIRRLLTLGRGVVAGMPEDAEQRDPLQLFGDWFADAEKSGLLMPEAMTLATATGEGRPSARMVLMKDYDEDGFVFFTNYGSRKAVELDSNPYAALLFHWSALQRQVRIEGSVSRVTQEESREYFNSRHRGSRIGAWASRQSDELPGRAVLEQRVRDYEQKFSSDVPLPSFWGGYRLKPATFEFWQGRVSRLHDRVCFERRDIGWKAYR
ncbi:MAG: pyridoxamine 5'-phosphate oxidase, partial [Gammaproteobacteria bacterium]|nr:pyridoxamine 5'-phosphate oxidase [Gammaproteobacteria bacterium]